MDIRSGHPYWLIRNGLSHAFSPLLQNVKYNLLVAGRGITGVLVSCHLAEAGYSTLMKSPGGIVWKKGALPLPCGLFN